MSCFTLVVAPHRLKPRNILAFHKEFIALIEWIVVHLLFYVFCILWPLLGLYVFDFRLVWHRCFYKSWSLETYANNISVLAVRARNSGGVTSFLLHLFEHVLGIVGVDLDLLLIICCHDLNIVIALNTLALASECRILNSVIEAL